jgi:hypothetical protein
MMIIIITGAAFEQNWMHPPLNFTLKMMFQYYIDKNISNDRRRFYNKYLDNGMNICLISKYS